MEAEDLSAVAGVLLSLGLSYIPGVKQYFGDLAPTTKRLVMLGLLLVCALGIFGLSCVRPGDFSPGLCSQDGSWRLLKVFIAAAIANQAAFELTPKARIKGEK